MRLCCMKMLLECTAPQRPPSSYKYCIATKLHGGRCSPWPNVQTRAKLHKGRLGKWIKRDTQSRLDLRRQGLCTAHHRFLINHENIRRVVRLQSGSGWVKEISASLQVWNQKTLLCVLAAVNAWASDIESKRVEEDSCVNSISTKHHAWTKHRHWSKHTHTHRAIISMSNTSSANCSDL